MSEKRFYKFLSDDNLTWTIRDLKDKKNGILVRNDKRSVDLLLNLLNSLNDENEHLRKELYECERDYLIETSDEVDRALYLDGELKELAKKYGVEDE